MLLDMKQSSVGHWLLKEVQRFAWCVGVLSHLEFEPPRLPFLRKEDNFVFLLMDLFISVSLLDCAV
jgi:hypothetical protein